MCFEFLPLFLESVTTALRRACANCTSVGNEVLVVLIAAAGLADLVFALDSMSCKRKIVVVCEGQWNSNLSHDFQRDLVQAAP